MKRILLLLALLAVRTAVAATFTVSSTNDTGAGSLRTAITSANATPGVTNLIQFAITNLTASGVKTITPATSLPLITKPVVMDGYTQPGSSSNTLANADNAVLLIEIKSSGGNNGLVLAGGSGGSTLRGLVLNNGWSSAIAIQTTNIVVEGCFLGTDPTGRIAQGNNQGIGFDSSFDTSSGRIGGTSPGQRNVISGNAIGVAINQFIGPSTNQVVQGNFIGTDATGTNALANSVAVTVLSSANLIGGTNAAARNIIAGNGNSGGIEVNNPSSGGQTGNRIQGNFIGTDVSGTKPMGFANGIFLGFGSSATQVGGLTATPGTPPGNVICASITGVNVFQRVNSNTIQGNLIGADASGTKALGNSVLGIDIQGAGNLVGGTNVMARNVIAASGVHGINIGHTEAANIHDNLVQGNFIGTDITGAQFLPNGQDGVHVEDSFSNTIGGTAAGAGNVIAGNGGRGVNVSQVFSAIGLAVLGNSIFANGALGIDLGGNGVTPNDADDGPNHLQNFPVITSVNINGGNVTLSGTLNSGTNASFRLEFFSNASCDSSGNGEGQTFLGFTNVVTDGSGNAAFALTLANPGGAVFTATATDTNGNTSEFSACASVSGPCSITCPANMVVSTAPNQCGAVVNFFPTTSGNCGGVASVPASGSFFPKGTNTVTCTTASGTNCSFTITVNDTVAPTITCPANIVTNVPSGQTSAVVNYPAAVFSDNCALAATNSSPPSGSLFPAGVTTVTCTATDTSGNSNTCSFTVTVATNAPPVAQCRNVTTNADASCQAIVAVTAVDNGSFDPDGTITNRTLNPPGPYAKGTNAVTLTVVDNLGASNSCAASIIVLDTTPPGITCPGNIATNLPAGQTTAVVNYPAPVVTDNCGVASTNCSPPSGSVFSLGLTTVTCTAADTSGNTNTCSFTVSLTASNTPPVLPAQTNRTIGEMTTLVVTNTATDADLPAQTLAYTLLAPPAGAGINATNGVITFTPSESFGPAAATITTRVVDNGSPPLSATNSFVVTVLDTIAVKLTVVNTNDSGPGSLRQAILTANTNGTILPDFIAFAITNVSHTVLLASFLPAVTQPVVIDGTTQLGAPAPVGTILNPPVEIRGTNFAIIPDVLSLSSTTNSLVRGLAISRCTAGFAIVISGGRSNRVESCHIGVGMSGESTNDGNFRGVDIINSSFNTIGGNLPGQGNVIGNNTTGIQLGGDNNTIQGNFIGVSRAGNPLGNSSDGMHTGNTTAGNIIGGTNAGQGNVIAFNGTQGFWNTAATTNTVRGNSIFSNGGLGIDVGPIGVTPNDVGDTDGFQNFPVIIATVSGGSTVISGVLTSRLAVASYAIDLYTNTVCDASGYGEGEFYLGTAVLTTAANGIGGFNLALPAAALPLGTKLAATATSSAGATSEFGPCAEVILPPALTVQRSNNLLTLTWSTNAASFRLETTFNLAPPASWQTITNGIINSGSSRAFTFTNNVAVTNQFFRLAFP